MIFKIIVLIFFASANTGVALMGGSAAPFSAAAAGFSGLFAIYVMLVDVTRR